MAELVEEGPNKRPRLWEQQQQQQQQDAGRGCQQDGWEVGGGGEDSATCVCSNTGCPWRFRSSRTSPTSRATGAAGSTNGPSPTPVVEPTDGDGDEDESGRLLPPRQVFDGPLLSVKEYRDEPTGEVRCVVREALPFYAIRWRLLLLCNTHILHFACVSNRQAVCLTNMAGGDKVQLWIECVVSCCAYGISLSGLLPPLPLSLTLS